MHTFDAEQCCSFVGAVEVGGRGWVGSTGVGMQDLRRMQSAASIAPAWLTRVRQIDFGVVLVRARRRHVGTSVCVRATEPGVAFIVGQTLLAWWQRRIVLPEALVRAEVGGRGRLLAARAEIFCSIVHFVGAVLLLVVRAAATEATRVGRLRAVMHLVLVGLAVGACLDVLLRGALQVADFLAFGDFLELPDLALGFTLFAEGLWADIWSVPAGMVCFVWSQTRADFVGAAAFGARPSSVGKARETLVPGSAEILRVSGSSSADEFEPRARFGASPSGCGKLVGEMLRSSWRPGGLISSLEDSGGMRESFAERFAAERCEIAESSPDLAVWRFLRSLREGFPSVT